MKTNVNNTTKPQHDAKLLVSGQSELLAAFLDWLIDNPERFKPNKPSLMLADEFLKSRQYPLTADACGQVALEARKFISRLKLFETINLI